MWYDNFTCNFFHISELMFCLGSGLKVPLTCVFVFPSIMMQTVSQWLWWDRLWLPANVSWSDLEDNEGRVYAKASQLYAALPCALCLLLVRYLFERWEYMSMCVKVPGVSELCSAIVWFQNTGIMLHKLHGARQSCAVPDHLLCSM